MNRNSVIVGTLLLVIILFVPRVREVFAPTRTVWAVNGLDVPLDASVAGKTPPGPPNEKKAPAESTPAQLATWHTVSKNGRARVEQMSIDGVRCTAHCEVSGAIKWSRNGCLSNSGEFRFTSGDCDCLIVLRVKGEGSWRYSPVLLIYRRGRLEKSFAAGDFISDENAIPPAGPTFDWLKSGGHVIADQSGIQFETRDGRKQRVLFAPKGPQ